jgi:regulation of enolase protein 1 (concanavalin A-like superfamily)
MTRLLPLGVITLALGLVTAAAGPGVGPAQGKKPQAVKGWGEVTDPDSDCRVTEEKGVLTITVPKSHHDLTYTDEYTKLNAPRVLRSAEGDFTLQAKVQAFPVPGDVTSSGGPHKFVSAGLLVWQDDKNFIRLERAAVAGPNPAFVWFERFEGGKSVSKGTKARLGEKDTGLRVERKGNRFKFSYDDGGEGKNWAEAHTEEVALPAKLRVGVAAVNTTAREFPARLTELELRPKK